MIDLVIGSFLVTLLPVVLKLCMTILSIAAGALVWRDDRPVSLRGRPSHSITSHSAV